MKMTVMIKLVLFCLGVLAAMVGCFGSGDPMVTSPDGGGWVNSQAAFNEDAYTYVPTIGTQLDDVTGGAGWHQYTGIDKSSVFISEYFEGLYGDRYIEIYNPTGSPVSPGSIGLRRYDWAGSAFQRPYEAPLSLIAPDAPPIAIGGVLVIYHNQFGNNQYTLGTHLLAGNSCYRAKAAGTDAASHVLDHDGADGLELVLYAGTNATVIDRIGLPTAHGAGFPDYALRNVRMIRNADVGPRLQHWTDSDPTHNDWGLQQIVVARAGVSSSSSSESSSSSTGTAVAFTGLTANGTSGSVTTTELTLTFDTDPATLAASDITVTGATKGALSGSGITRTLAISDITVANGDTVSIAIASPAGFSITPTSKTAVVYVNIVDLSYRGMATVPGGTFMQTVTSDGGPFSHTITGFKLGMYEVTYELWYTVYTWAIANGYVFANAGREGNDGTIGAAPTTARYEPVSYINWRDAIVWCNAYSQLVGLIPVYCSDSEFAAPIKDSSDGSHGGSVNTTDGSFDNPYVNPSATGYGLPTEGQWQYAACYQGGGSWTPHTWASGATADYSVADACAAVAVYGGSVPQAVGTRTANQLGIFDMSGNVFEFCWDWSGTLPTSALANYRGAVSGSGRVVRGGSYNTTAEFLQIGARELSTTYFEQEHVGFRVALP